MTPSPPPTPWIQPIQLKGEHAILLPLDISHEKELQEAVQDGELWKLWYTLIPPPERMREEIDRRLGLQKIGNMLPFSVYSTALQRIVGMTTYMNIEARYLRLEIGSTWYARSVQRTPLNTNCKRMLLCHAFETLNCIAVEFRTAFFNTRSRNAILRLGAKQDGILRSHQRYADGSLRDTCVYSIIASEWASVKQHLDFELSQERP